MQLSFILRLYSVADFIQYNDKHQLTSTALAIHGGTKRIRSWHNE